jgi:hypothetical protein
MKRLTFAVLGVFLAVALSACKCPAAKQAAQEVENSHKLIAPMFLDYVGKDASLTDKEKARRKTLVDTDFENIQKLKKALED